MEKNLRRAHSPAAGLSVLSMSRRGPGPSHQLSVLRGCATFPASPDAPVLAGFVKVVVYDNYVGDVNVRDKTHVSVKALELTGEAWGPPAQ